MFADIPNYSVLDFPWQILQLNEKGVGNLQRDHHLGSFNSGKLNLLVNFESGPVDTVLGFLIFIFPLIL